MTNIDHSAMYVALETFVDSAGFQYEKDKTRVSGEEVAKHKWGHLFKPLEVSHPVIEAATAAPGEKRGARKPKAKAKAKPKAAPEPAEKPKAAPGHSTGLSMGSFAQVESATAAPGEKRGEKP